jgi:hypothetical protein
MTPPEIIAPCTMRIRFGMNQLFAWNGFGGSIPMVSVKN